MNMLLQLILNKPRLYYSCVVATERESSEVYNWKLHNLAVVPPHISTQCIVHKQQS